MKIFLKDLPEIGLNIDKKIEAKELGLSEENFKCNTPLEIKARIEKADDAVLAKVQVKGTYELSCARCLEPVVSKRTDQFDLYFEINPTTEFIDFGEDVRQEMIITLSAVILCQEDCKGICPDCGTNLNKETCQCSQTRGAVTGILRK